MAGH
ncbi:unnamed protein product [Linum tenue]|jgi:hypothetical protein